MDADWQVLQCLSQVLKRTKELEVQQLLLNLLVLTHFRGSAQSSHMTRLLSSVPSDTATLLSPSPQG